MGNDKIKINKSGWNCLYDGGRDGEGGGGIGLELTVKTLGPG